jgi:chromosome segregation ATPase
MSAIMAEVYMSEGGVGLEPRVARIESDVANLKETATRIEKRFDKVDDRFDKVDERFEKIDERFDKVDERFEKVDERFDKVDERFQKLDGKVSDLGTRMTAMERGFALMRESQTMLHVDLRDLRNSLDIKFLWIVTTMIAFGGAILGAMAKGFHWLK